MNLDDLIKAVAAPTFENVFNPWSQHDDYDAPTDGPTTRCRRLFQHFSCPVPQYLLIGEAPGYQGCHFSGVPFTNEKLILSGVVPRVTRRDRITLRQKPWSEPSATIMWRVLHQLGIATSTVMWNAFAWHPHKPGEPYSNRAPTRTEVENGWNVLRAVLTHFNSARIVAVGNVAAEALKRLAVTATKVRHPSMGGARDFEDGMRELMESA